MLAGEAVVAIWNDIEPQGRATDAEGAGVRTVESRDRTDLLQPPSWFLLLEATDPGALELLLPDADRGAAGRVRAWPHRLDIA